MAPPKKDTHKQSLYFPEQMFDEIKSEARRLKRSVSWVVQRAWRIARKDLKSIPSASEEP